MRVPRPQAAFPAPPSTPGNLRPALESPAGTSGFCAQDLVVWCAPAPLEGRAQSSPTDGICDVDHQGLDGMTQPGPPKPRGIPGC